MTEFFTDPQGRVRPIEGKKKGGAGALLVAGAVAAAALGAGGGGAADGALDTLQKQQLKARTSQAKESARKGHADQAWGPIGSRALGLAGITFTAHHYQSRPAGTLLVIAETEPAGGTPHAELLDAVAAVASELPPP